MVLFTSDQTQRVHVHGTSSPLIRGELDHVHVLVHL